MMAAFADTFYSTAKNGARIVVDKRSLWQRKALKGSRLRLLIWGRLSRIFGRCK